MICGRTLLRAYMMYLVSSRCGMGLGSPPFPFPLLAAAASGAAAGSVWREVRMREKEVASLF